jgi:hypothetical protein
MPSGIPRRRQPPAKAITSKVQKQKLPKDGSTLFERAGDSIAEAYLRRELALENEKPRRQTIGYSGPKTPLTPRVLKRKSMAAIPIRVSPRPNKGQRSAGNTTLITSTTTSPLGVGSKSSGNQTNLRQRRTRRGV